MHISSSEAWVLGDLGDLIPVRLTSTSVGVSVTLSVVASFADTATVRGSTAGCPISYQNSTYWNGTTWFNQTYGAADCQVLSNVYVDSYAYLQDRTTGLYFYPSSTGSTSWSNESGYTASYFAYTADYSNPSYWLYNYSAPGSWTNYSYGAGGAMTISATPTYFFNGSFSSGHRYVLGIYIDNEVFSEQAYFAGTARATLNAATLGNHEDITGVAVY